MELSKQRPVRPPLRWVGGKSSLIPALLPLLPKNFGCFVEPMVGSGALFFAVQPEAALLADANPELINYYRILSTRTDEFISHLIKIRASKKMYYILRSSRPTDDLERAIRFAYLNRLSWNGVYRVNQQGQFNVPIGDRLPTKLWKEKHLRSCARVLRAVKLMNCDFEESVKYATKGDFVYFDPPYPKGQTKWSGFNRYSENPFNKDDFFRLRRTIKELHARNVLVMVSSSIVDPNHDRYPSFLTPQLVESRSLISASSSGRYSITEIVLRNY